MKIGIITIHFGFNYGSALQAYALSKYINSTFDDIEAYVINYIPERYSKKNRYIKTAKEYRFLKRGMYLLAVAPFQMYVQYIFNKFLKSYVPMTRRVSNKEEAQEVSKDMEILIAGSDQIWNSDYNGGIDPIYYLEFAGTEKRKVSYAASCGKNDYNKKEWEIIDNFLKFFSYISLREEDSLNLFRSHGYIEAVQSLDPVFLINKNEWKKIERKPGKSLKKYVLIYCLDSDETELIRIARQIASEKNLKIAMATYCHIWNYYDVDMLYRNKSPNEFLWLVSHADYIVTNSFHGVAFSINLEKQFVAVKRKKYNCRLDSILKIMGLSDRYIGKGDKFYGKEDIDYNIVNLYKQDYLSISKEYLSNVLCP